MIYSDFKGEKLSLLGMGNMRLPTDSEGNIDYEAGQEIIDLVYDSGVNYFDTAYMYHGGKSEVFLGKALKKYPRESFYLADKMPGMQIKPDDDPSKVAAIFEEQLARCGVKYFDFYLLHCLNATTYEIYTSEKFGVVNYLLEQKKLGRIRHLGFSSHASTEILEKFLDRYDCFEFVQIQLNYIDWERQNAKKQYEIITSHGLPVWVMEPCRGGRLVSLCPEADELLKGTRPDKSIPSWAFRYVESLPNVRMILSGMTKLEQAKDNLATFDVHDELSDDERKVLDRAVEIMKDKLTVPCTKCHYCDGCPMGLDIPMLLELYGKMQMDGAWGAIRAIDALDEDKRPSACVACGRCVGKCPQNINIPDIMKKFADKVAEMKK